MVLVGDGTQPSGNAAVRMLRRSAGVSARLLCNFKGERTALVKTLVFRRLRRITPFIAVDRDGARFFVSTKDNLGLNLFCYQPLDEQYFAATLRLRAKYANATPLGTLLDIGANIGTTTVPALLRHGFTRALAIEPAPENLFLLRQNVYANELSDRVTIVAAAASDENGYVEMEMSPHNAAGNRVRVGTARPGDLGEDQWTTTRVAARTVDSIMDEHGVTAEEVGLVWI